MPKIPPVWVGELYLELHRGTYTSQAKNKRGNRKSEFLLRDAEFFDAVTLALAPERKESVADPERAVYDVTGLRRVASRNSPHGAGPCMEAALAQPVPRHHSGLVDPLGLSG